MISFASGQLPVPSVQIKAMFSRVFFFLLSSMKDDANLKFFVFLILKTAEDSFYVFRLLIFFFRYSKEQDASCTHSICKTNRLSFLFLIEESDKKVHLIVTSFHA